MPTPYLTFNKKRPMSWSSLSLFDEPPYCNPEKWYQKYVIHQDCTRSKYEGSIITQQAFCAVTGIIDDENCPQNETSREMQFGSLIDKALQLDPTFLPHVPRYTHMQYELRTKFGAIPLVGYPDGLELIPKKRTLADYKTGKAPWTQKKADEAGQLTMYLLLLWIIEKIPPEEFECMIHWLPTKDNGDFSISLVDDTDLRTFYTSRTMVDILRFGQRINATYKAMEEYCKNHD